MWQLRRMVAVEVLPAGRDFFVEVRRGKDGAVARFELKGGQVVAGSEMELARPPPRLLQKVLSFKSVCVEDEDCGVCHGP